MKEDHEYKKLTQTQEAMYNKLQKMGPSSDTPMMENERQHNGITRSIDSKESEHSQEEDKKETNDAEKGFKKGIISNTTSLNNSSAHTPIASENNMHKNTNQDNADSKKVQTEASHKQNNKRSGMKKLEKIAKLKKNSKINKRSTEQVTQKSTKNSKLEPEQEKHQKGGKKNTVIVNRPPILYHPPPEIYHRPPIILHRPPILIQRPAIVYHQPPVVVHRPAVLYRQPPLVFHQPPPVVSQPMMHSEDSYSTHSELTPAGSRVVSAGSLLSVPHTMRWQPDEQTQMVDHQDNLGMLSDHNDDHHGGRMMMLGQGEGQELGQGEGQEAAQQDYQTAEGEQKSGIPKTEKKSPITGSKKAILPHANKSSHGKTKREEPAMDNPTNSTANSTTDNPTNSTINRATDNPTNSTANSTTDNPTNSTINSATNNPTNSTINRATDNPANSTANSTNSIANLVAGNNNTKRSETATHEKMGSKKDVVVNRPPIIYHPPPEIYHRPDIVIHRPPIVIHRPPIIYHQPPVIVHRPAVVYHQPPIIFHQPPPAVQQPLLYSHDTFVVHPSFVAQHLGSILRTAHHYVGPPRLLTHLGQPLFKEGHSDYHPTETHSFDLSHMGGEESNEAGGHHGLGMFSRMDNYGGDEGHAGGYGGEGHAGGYGGEGHAGGYGGEGHMGGYGGEGHMGGYGGEGHMGGYGGEGHTGGYGGDGGDGHTGGFGGEGHAEGYGGEGHLGGFGGEGHVGGFGEDGGHMGGYGGFGGEGQLSALSGGEGGEHMGGGGFAGDHSQAYTRDLSNIEQMAGDNYQGEQDPNDRLLQQLEGRMSKRSKVEHNTDSQAAGTVKHQDIYGGHSEVNQEPVHVYQSTEQAHPEAYPDHLYNTMFDHEMHDVPALPAANHISPEIHEHHDTVFHTEPTHVVRPQVVYHQDPPTIVHPVYHEVESPFGHTSSESYVPEEGSATHYVHYHPITIHHHHIHHFHILKPNDEDRVDDETIHQVHHHDVHHIHLRQQHKNEDDDDDEQERKSYINRYTDNQQGNPLISLTLLLVTD